MTELSPEAKKLFEAAREAYTPSAQRLDALQSALTARIAADAAAASGAASAGGAAKLALAVKAVALVGVATAVAIGASLWRDAQEPSAPSRPEAGVRLAQATASPPATAVLPPPIVAAPGSAEPVPSVAASDAPTGRAPAGATPASDAAAPEPAAPVRRVAAPARPAARRTARAPEPGTTSSQTASPSAAARAPASEPASASAAEPARLDERPEPAAEETAPADPAPVVTRDALDAEVRLLRAARSALDGGAPERALSILDAHAEQHPRGTLTQERLATRALALCALGRTSAARAVVRELRLLSPSSPHLSRLRASCAWPAER